LVHWALTLQFHGGKRIIDDLRGKANAGKGKHGKLDMNVGDWGIFLPANSTLRNYLPPVEVYEGFKPETIENFKKGYPESSPRKVVIAWDEIEIRYGPNLEPINEGAYWQGGWAYYGERREISRVGENERGTRHSRHSVLLGVG